jgi:hypothetical protein
MPFKSEKQRKWMHANEPEMAKKWEKEEKNEGKLKERIYVSNVKKVGKLEKWTIKKGGQKIDVLGSKKFFDDGKGFSKNDPDDALELWNLGKKFKGKQVPDVYGEGKLKEAKKRDYKAEYKKYGSSKKAKKYRAELNKYNRQKGTYGNGDKKDASHKGGKIVGFEEQSKNRGRREKSRLKKEQKLREIIRKMIEEDFAGAYPAHKREKFDNKRRKQSEVLGYKLTGVNDVRTEIDDATVKEGKITEDYKNNKWEVYIADEKGREKIVKVAKSKRAGVILYNKLINTDKYHEVGMRVIKEGKLTEAKEPLWTKETVKDAIKQIKKGLKNAVPYLDDIGTGFGGESIIGKISLDPKKTWSNGILQNSRWALIHFFPDGTLDTIRMNGYSSYETRKKVPILRKSKNKSLKQAIDRMGRYFTVVRTKHPDTK